jgi:hypothetical protein
VRSGPGEARTILLLHIISDRSSKQPLMVSTLLNVYMDLGSYFVSARTNKRHHHQHISHGHRHKPPQIIAEYPPNSSGMKIVQFGFE